MTCTHPVVSLPHKCETDETLWVCGLCATVVYKRYHGEDFFTGAEVESRKAIPVKAGDTINEVITHPPSTLTYLDKP